MSDFIRDGLCFDDVLLVPVHSTVESRSSVDLCVNLPKGICLKNPIIPANMKTIVGCDMHQAMMDMGSMSLIQRFQPLEDQLDTLDTLSRRNIKRFLAEDFVGFSIGVKESDKESVAKFVELGAKIVCIDIAHGDSSLGMKMCRWVADNYPQLLLIAGNVATASGASRLWMSGADIVKVGVGPGSLCTTRIETGNGVPQLTALMDVAKVRDTGTHFKDKMIIADGGIKNAGDCVKALCFADMVMIGNVFAGAVETPGDTISFDGRLYKEYVGSSTHKANHIEGVKAMVPQKGHVKDIMTKLIEGIRSGCSYQGSANLKELRENPEFIRISNAGLQESHPHDVHVIK